MFRNWTRGCLIVLISVMVIAVLLVGFITVRSAISQHLADEMYSYHPIDSDPPIAQLKVQATGTGIRWKVQLSVQGSSGQWIDHVEPCDTWHLTADIINIWPWIAVSVPPGWYVLTTLVGTDCLNEHGKIDASMNINIPIEMNTGPIKQNGLFVNLTQVSSNSIGPDGKTYNAFINATSLSLIATG